MDSPNHTPTSIIKQLRANPNLFLEGALKPNWLNSGTIYERPDVPGCKLVTIRFTAQPEHTVKLPLDWLNVFAYCSSRDLGGLVLDSSTTKAEVQSLRTRWKSKGDDKQDRNIIVARITMGAEHGFVVKHRNEDLLDLAPDNLVILPGPSKRIGRLEFVEQMWDEAAGTMQTARELGVFQSELQRLMTIANKAHSAFRAKALGLLDKEALVTKFNKEWLNGLVLGAIKLDDGDTVLDKLNEYLHNPEDGLPLNEAIAGLISGPEFLSAPVGTAFIAGTQVDAIETLTKSYWARAVQRLLVEYPDLPNTISSKLAGGV